MLSATTWGESVIKTFNDQGYGTISGHLQSLSMYRDFEGMAAEDYAYSTTLGLQLDYLSPKKSGWRIGASYVGVGVLDSSDYDDRSNPGEYLLSPDSGKHGKDGSGKDGIGAH